MKKKLLQYLIAEDELKPTERYLILSLLLSALLSVLIIGSFNTYSLIADYSGHTGFNPYSLYNLFVPLALISGWLTVQTTNYSIRRLAIIVLALQAIGILNVFLFDIFNIMVNYEETRLQGLL